MSETLLQVIKRAADNGDQIYSLVCVVNSVNESERTCDVSPLNEDADVLQTRLSATLNSTQGVVIIPKVDTNVIVTFLTKDVGFVAMCTDAEKVLIDCDTVIFNGGNKGAMVKIQDLVDKINRLENTFNSHVHPGVTVGGGVTAITATQIIPITTVANLANNEITQ